VRKHRRVVVDVQNGDVNRQISVPGGHAAVADRYVELVERHRLPVQFTGGLQVQVREIAARVGRNVQPELVVHVAGYDSVIRRHAVGARVLVRGRVQEHLVVRRRTFRKRNGYDGLREFGRVVVDVGHHYTHLDRIGGLTGQHD